MTAEISAPLFLVLLAGMPHGAGDILIARRIFQSNYRQLTLFLISYIVIAAFIIFTKKTGKVFGDVLF